MQFKDKTTFTSDPIRVTGDLTVDVFLTVTGPGPVALQMLEEDGVYRAFPETTFSGNTAQVVRVKSGAFKVDIQAATATTVEVRLKQNQ